MNEIVALAVSYLFIFLVIGIASALLSTGKISPFSTRKVVHIGVSNWWIFAMLFFDSPVIALIGPVSFILINYISYKKHIFAAMEHEIPRKNLGTIYFPVSLTIMVLLSFAGPMPKSAAAAGILVLGYGDGCAALFGNALAEKSWSIPFLKRRKTAAGSSAMFLASFLVLAALQVWFHGYGELSLLTAGIMALIAAAVTVVEACTPYGLDNISIPLATAFLSWWLL
jgi:phytol kinase